MSTDELALSTGSRRGAWASVALVALTLLMVLEVLRTLYPLGYWLVGDLGMFLTPVVLVVFFFSPLLAPLVRHAGPRNALIVCVGGLAAVRLLLQILAPPPLWAALLGTVVALVAVTTVLAAVLGKPHGAETTTLGFVVALGLDAALKSAYAAWDRVWQEGIGPLLVTVLVIAGLLTALRLALASGLEVAPEPARGRLGRMFAVAVLLMPAMLMLQSVAFIGSSGRLSLPWAAAVTIGGSALAVLVTAFAAVARVGRMVGLAAGGVLAVVVWAMTAVTGPGVAILAVAGQALTGVLLLAVLTDEPTTHRRPGLWRATIGATLGFVMVFILTLLYPSHYETPLPIPNTLLPPIAVGLGMLGLLARRGSADAPPAAVAPVFSIRAVLAPACGLLMIGAGVGIGLALTAADPAPLASAQFPLTVATFNTDQGARETGELDFEAAADQIAALDADVVALQEVTRGWPLSGMNDFAAWLHQTRGTTQYYAPAADEQFGNLLVTRVRLTDVEVLPLPQGAGTMERSAILATIDTPDGEVTVITVHLQHRNSGAGIAAREQQLLVVLEQWAGAPRTIILGDFNANNQPAPDGGPKLLVGPDQKNTLEPLLDAGFTTTQPTEVCTMPTSNENCSDYVFVTPDLLQEPPVEVLPPGVVGDHRPVRSTVLPR